MILSKDDINANKKYSRIISLVPSQTELLFDLGLNEEVIGLTKFCIHPEEWFRNKTRVGGTKNINLKVIDQLSPDLIIANKEENVKEQIEELAQKYDVWITDVNDLNEAVHMIQDIGKLTNRVEASSTLALKIKEEFEKLKSNSFEKRKIPAAYFIWKDPYMVAAAETFINDMMKYCGLQNSFSDQKRYPQISLEEIKKKKCELILLSSEPYPFKQKQKEEIQTHLPKIKIELVDGEMFSWYGSRLLKSINYFQSFINKMNPN
jgi:ABC-type Fe3+-hydroxamate transport system substrate-binding protein